MTPLAACRLYGIVDLGYVSPEAIGPITRALIEGGADLVQLRAKGFTPEQLVPLGTAMHAITASAGVPLILNDHPALVPIVGAEGVHIGQDDGTIEAARTLAGPGKWVGRSTHSPDQAREAFLEGADYIGFGPLFATPTKPDYPAIGLDGIRQVVVAAPVPVFCIGGIKPENLADVLAAGAERVVMVSALLRAPNPVATTAAVRAQLVS